MNMARLALRAAVRAKQGEHKHAGYGHVEPDRQSVSRHLLMNREASGEREEEAREDKGEDDGRQGHVRDENKEIKRPNGAVAAELRVSMHRMVNDVRAEKERRSRQRANPPTSAGRDAPPPHALVGATNNYG